MEYTGERMIPGVAGLEDDYIEHLARYIFASERLEGKRVLETGCGSGYGAALLSEWAAEVVAIDCSGEAIAWCRKRYGRSNLHFEKMDCRQLAFRGGTFDAVVSFELLEHLNERDQLFYLEEVVRVLNDDRGELFISTPNVDHNRYVSPFHKRELTLDEFQHLLRRHFRQMEIYGQSVRPETARGRRLERKMTELEARLARAESQLAHPGRLFAKALLPPMLRRAVRPWLKRLLPGEEAMIAESAVGETGFPAPLTLEEVEFRLDRLDKARTFLAVCARGKE